ncbi:MAG: restriction endonuclease [Sphingopyxis sp.]|nr:restriction endonuclease [Sphingopyxis sp.]
MSSIKPAELTMVDEVLRRAGNERGYILDFSNRTFAEFFELEFDTDIYGGDYESEGTSKASRLRCFLKRVDDGTAARVLRRLLEHRQALPEDQRSTIRPLGEGQLIALIGRLERGEPSSGVPPKPIFNRQNYEMFRDRLKEMWNMDAHQRGYAFETYLKDLFDAFHLKARGPFSLTGEQIDGSFELGNEIYLLEAKWHKVKVGAQELHAFHGKLEQKAAWTRGLFVSFGGFTDVGLYGFGRGGKKLICMEGKDIYEALDRNLPIDALLEAKIRHAAEFGEVLAPVSVLFPTA